MTDTFFDDAPDQPDVASASDIALLDKSFLFDADWYRQTYPEVALSGRDPAEHYCNDGWRLGYAPGPHFTRHTPDHDAGNPLLKALRERSLRNPAFDRRIDGSENPDFLPCPEPAFEEPGRFNSSHVGPAEILQPVVPGWDCRFAGTVAVHLHLFHVEMALDFRRWLDAIPVPFDLFVSVPHTSEVITAERVFSRLENVRRITAVSFPNVGRDIAPMIAGFGMRLAPYDLVLHMHSKKSSHTPGKRDWSVQMGHHLLGSRGHAAAMLEMFEDRPDLGLVFPTYHPSVRKQIKWGANFATCRELMARAGARLYETDLTPFPAGSFFAIRGALLRPLLAGSFRFEDFGAEAGQVDGTLAHAIERSFALLCRQFGYSFRQIRAARPFSMGSMVLGDEPYVSARLAALRTEQAPSLPQDSAPASLRTAVISGGPGAEPLPYEHLFSDARYLFYTDAPLQEGARCGQWQMCKMPDVAGGGWIAAAAAALAKDTDIAIWVAPRVSVVEDLTSHVFDMMRDKGVCGVFQLPDRESLQAEISRLASRHPTADLEMALGAQTVSKQQPVSDLDLIVMDLRRPDMRALLECWQARAATLAPLPAGQDLAFDLACDESGVRVTRLYANGCDLSADPRLRIFGASAAVHPYADVMPRISELMYEGGVRPTARQRQALSSCIDVVLPVATSDSPDALARTLQRLESLADARCRLIVVPQEALPAPLEAVIDRHLARNPRDLREAAPAAALRGDHVALLAPGILPTPGWIDPLSMALSADAAVPAVAPLVLAGMDEADGLWSDRLATQCRKAAEAWNAPTDTLATPGARPMLLRRDVAMQVLSAELSDDALGKLRPRLVFSALMLAPGGETADQPDSAKVFLDRLLRRYRTVSPQVSPVAFYLPQFHPFETNDTLWGAGFSEWRNVVRARPRFPEHHQPRLPGDLGYYDLRTPDTLRAQGELAELHGLHGMACYYYRFGDKRLMEEPTDVLLANGTVPLRFFYCWANEDWTRAWDGRSDDVNLKQDYSDRTISLILDDLVRVCSDTRYIRVDGKPVFMIYQLNKLPDLENTLNRFREGMRARLGIEICLGTTYNPEFREEWAGLVDFVAQFPPHRTPRKRDRDLLRGEKGPRIFDPSREDFFESYSSVAQHSLEALDMVPRLQPGVCPDWDNASRRAQKAHILVGATPERFGKWVRNAAHATVAKRATGATMTPFLFVNAWNEWAEGAVMEPYEGDGRANLAAFSANLPWQDQR
ncbi:glycoside hydrolase family 99-like domain-containing protein [Salipiger sp. 1_MG-2023]|nr:glycoside hydrolase family 99-like domain-containing protein [Salipiger sp. 1_MG-2023]